jgi:ABC-type lipoprotein release transport system permease subunit
MTTWHALKTIFLGRSFAWRFAGGVIFGLAFSMMATWAALGIMDGFEEVFYKALRAGSGEYILKSVHGYFTWNQADAQKALHLDLVAAPVVRTEAFLTVGKHAQGVQVIGIDDTAVALSPLLQPLAPGEIALGQKLAAKLNLREGDAVALTFGRGQGAQGLPILERFIIKRVVAHHLYIRDARQVYLNLGQIQQILGTKKINLVMLATLAPVEHAARQEMVDQIFHAYDAKYEVMPFWHEFGNLLQAVHDEKFILALALQLIVLIAAFNVLAFIWFLRGQAAQEIFLLQALGLPPKKIRHTWYTLTTILWAAGVLLGLGLLEILKKVFAHLLPKLMPPDIYHVDGIFLSLTVPDYLIVAGAAWLWMMLVVVLGILKMQRQSLLYGLRREFN